MKKHIIDFEIPNLIIKKIIRSSISDVISKGVDPKYLLYLFLDQKKNLTKISSINSYNQLNKKKKNIIFHLVVDTILSNKFFYCLCYLDIIRIK